MLGTVPTSVAGNDIRITGYGSTSPANSLYLVQKTLVGPLSQINATSLCYATDTTGGNSGSPIIHEQTGNAIGIHTNAGCSANGGCNTGTRIDRPALLAAIQNAGISPGTFTSFGTGCPGTGSVPNVCFAVNGSGGTSTASIAANEYAYEVVTNSALSIAAVRLWTQSTTGATATIPIAIYPSAGAGPSATPLATASMTVGTTSAFYQANFSPAVNIGPGTFYIGADHSAQTTYLADLTAGTAANAYWRRPPGSGAWALSTIVTHPSWQVVCAGAGQSGAVPVIGHVGVPQTGMTFQIALSRAATSTPVVLVSGSSNTSWLGNALPFSLAGIGAPQCQLLVDATVFDSAVTDGQGNGSLSIPVPNVPGLVGGEVFHQWAVLDPAANALGVVLSDGGHSTIGG